MEEAGQTEPTVTVLGTFGTILSLKVPPKLGVEDETKVDALKCVVQDTAPICMTEDCSHNAGHLVTLPFLLDNSSLMLG